MKEIEENHPNQFEKEFDGVNCNWSFIAKCSGRPPCTIEMKRTRSPSPPPSSQRRRLNDTDSVSGKKSIKGLEGLELHPLLSANTALTVSVKDQEVVAVKENPFLAHWNKVDKKKQNQRIPHVDRNLATEPSVHRPRPLKFNAPGKYIAQADAERTAAQIRLLEREIAEATEDLGADLDVAVVADILRANECAVEFEWWDVPFVRLLSKGSKDSADSEAKGSVDSKAKDSDPKYPETKDSNAFTLATDLLGNLIQRPSLRSINTTSTTTSSKIYLTPEERKKLRRQRRLEAQKELQEKIALGLVAPPAPKVKLSSLPRMLAQPGNTLGDESVQTPTQIAATIRAQTAARQEAHDQGNAQRKLTEEERAAKKYRKFAELDAEEVHVAVFKLNDRLEDGGKRFKVLINAEQNHLSGRSVTTPNFTLIIVEGGPKGIKRYTRLLLDRLQPDDPTWAQLLWSGTQPAKSELEGSGKKPFQMKMYEKNFEAVEYLQKCGYSQFWSLANKE